MTSRLGALLTRERPRHSSRNLLWERSFLDRDWDLWHFALRLSVCKPRAASPHCDPKHPKRPRAYPASESKTSHNIRQAVAARRSLFLRNRRAAPRANSRSTPCSWRRGTGPAPSRTRQDIGARRGARTSRSACPRRSSSWGTPPGRGAGSRPGSYRTVEKAAGSPTNTVLRVARPARGRRR